MRTSVTDEKVFFLFVKYNVLHRPALMLMAKIRQMAPLYEIKYLNLVLIISIALMYAKRRGNFLDVQQNAEWHRFSVSPGSAHHDRT